MQNIIISGMLRDFAARHGLESDKVELQFEKFVNYCLWKIDHYDTFDFDRVGTGSCIGVDGVGISIGGVLVDDIEEARALTRSQFDARFLFSQAKTSSSLDLGEIHKFISTVKGFFLGKEQDQPPELLNAWRVKQVLYSERSAKMRLYPKVELAFAYTGRHQLEPNSPINTQVRLELEHLKKEQYLTSSVQWHLHDGEALARLYREALNDTRKKFAFQRHVALPPIHGADAAYIGLVRCKDYVGLIARENGDINKGLFFENVRDYLGSNNPVNSEIARTIHAPDERDQFAILNNGVTVVARKVNPSGDSFEIERFQIVNGCQTSHVLFENRDALTDDMFITLKLIQTSDMDLTGKVITTTNSQSTVTKEAFATIRPYHRTIEDFYDAMRAVGYEYHYERRPHQFDDRDDIADLSIVSAPVLIKSFVSVVMEEPHKVHYYYGRLLEEYNANKASELFAESDYPGLYFAAHHLAAETRRRLRKTYSGWYYHLALLVRRQIAPELKKGGGLQDRSFVALLNTIDDGLDAALEVAKEVLSRNVSDQNQNRIPPFTRKLLDDLQRLAIPSSKAAPLQPPAKARPLNPGDYLGRAAEVGKADNRVTVKFGPHEVELRGPRASTVAVGDRVLFRVSPGGEPPEILDPAPAGRWPR